MKPKIVYLSHSHPVATESTVYSSANWQRMARIDKTPIWENAIVLLLSVSTIYAVVECIRYTAVLSF
jgi:hypothetical protein